ncbi:MAG: energy-coupling factor transporter transmembrane protein EcfT, partial [Peptostreptococcaceae bacterium]|nr:energy-coupling factor transporter transmembrane protein EcfT [Peptostreptococcaceae bacterium]
MLQDITIGQYYPTNSIIHKLDPRVKIMFTIIFMISLFVIDKFTPYIFIVLFLSTIIVLTKIPFSYIFRGVKGIIY